MANKELPVLQNNGKPRKPRLKYDCSKCTGYCCSYDWIPVTKRDIERLARRFSLTFEVAKERFTKYIPAYKRDVLRHTKDPIFKTTCQFFHKEKRHCTVYEHRPAICREYPEENRCGYYDFLMWEREHQDDQEFIPLPR